MTIRFCFLSVFVFIVGLCNAQRFNWSTSAGYPGVANSYVGAIDMATDEDGNVYVMDYANLPQVCQGVTIEMNGTGMVLFMYKFNPEGQLIWGKSIGTDAGSLTPLNIEYGSDGNIYALAHTNSSGIFSESATFPINGPVNVILTLNTDGELLSVYSTGFSCPACLCLETANDALYFQSGHSTIRSINFEQEIQDEFTFYFDPATAIMTLPLLGSGEFSNGDLLFAGLQRGDASLFEGDTLFQVDNAFLYSNITYMRLTPGLEPVWANTFGYMHDPESHFIPVSVDGNDQIYSGWEVLHPTTVLGTTIDGDFNNWAGALISMNEDGDPLWVHELASNTAMRFTYLFSDHETDKTWISVFTGSQATLGSEVLTPQVNGSPIIAAVNSAGEFSSAIALDGMPGGSKGLSIGKGVDNQLYLGGMLNNGSAYSINCIDYDGSKGLFVASFLDLPTTPPVPSITTSGNVTLTASPVFEGNIQWYFNNEPIDGANNITYQAEETGSYSVVYSYDFGCVAESSSEIEDVIVIGIDEQHNMDLQVYPNPSDNVVWIKGLSVGSSVLEVFDITGALVHQSRYAGNTHSFSVNGFSPGSYFLRIKTNGLSHTSVLMVK